MRKYICNLCGKEFNEFDEKSNLGMYASPGYGSKYDSQMMRFDFCIECFDAIADACKVPPIDKDFVADIGD